MLNRDKTVIIVFSAPRHSASCDVNHINIDGPTKTVINIPIGVIFDDKLQDITAIHCSKDCLLVPSDVYSSYKILQHAFSRGRVNMNT